MLPGDPATLLRVAAAGGVLMGCTSQPVEAPPPPSSAAVAVAPPGAIGAGAAVLEWSEPRGASGRNIQSPHGPDRDGGMPPMETDCERDQDAGVAL